MKNTKLMIAIVACAFALCFGLVACGGSSSSASSAASSAASSSAASSSAAASESASSAAASSAAASSAAASDTASSAAASSAAASASSASSDTADMETYMGMSSAGEAYYFAIDADATYGILVILNANGQYLSFVGPIATSGNQLQITDSTTGDKFGFEVLQAADGGLILDAGDQAGQIALAECTADEFAEAIAAIDSAGTAVN